MKNFTTRVVVLLISFITVLSSLNAAEKRYVFVLGGFPKTDPGWGAGWVDYRTDDLNRILYIWPSSNSLLVTPLVGTGSLGQQDYTAFSISNLGWWGCGYYVGPDTGNATASIDLTDVTSSWYFHFAIRTTCATDITLSLYGSTLDPTDPFLNTNTKGTVVLNSTILPLSNVTTNVWLSSCY